MFTLFAEKYSKLLEEFGAKALCSKIFNENYMDMCAFVQELYERSINGETSFKTINILSFMRTVKGNNNTKVKNGVKKLQYFLNACIQEYLMLKYNASSLCFIRDDHRFLKANSFGADVPDFFLMKNGQKVCKLEAKMFYSTSTYLSTYTTINFHKADYVAVYVIDERAWYFSRKIDNYSELYKQDALIGQHSEEVKKLVLPKVPRVFFDVSESAVDKDVPEFVNFKFL